MASVVLSCDRIMITQSTAYTLKEHLLLNRIFECSSAAPLDVPSDRTIISVRTEITDTQYATYTRHAAIHRPLGRDGHPMGHEPLRSANPRPALSGRRRPARRRDRRDARYRPLQRQRRIERIDCLEPRSNHARPR